jgi:hypothetical protein
VCLSWLTDNGQGVRERASRSMPRRRRIMRGRTTGGLRPAGAASMLCRGQWGGVVLCRLEGVFQGRRSHDTNKSDGGGRFWNTHGRRE